MPGYSNKTAPVSFRIPIELHAIILRRIQGKRSHWATVNEYIKERVIKDTQRKH